MKWSIDKVIFITFLVIYIKGFTATSNSFIPKKRCNDRNTIDSSECQDNSSGSEPADGTLHAFNLGRKLGIDECRRQFRWSRWNCSTIKTRGIESPRASPGTRESGYVSAITSAGIVYTIAQACARGNISSCGCAPPTTLATGGINKAGDSDRDNSNAAENIERINDEWDKSIRSISVQQTTRYWRWGGCSADVEYGVKLARKLTNPLIQSTSASGNDVMLQMMNSHNEKVGRKLIQLTLNTECKCHGVSGSCTLKTCWLKLPLFRTIGLKLTEMYKNAGLIQINGSSSISNSKTILLKRNKNQHHSIQPNSDNGKSKSMKSSLMILSEDKTRSRAARRTELVYLKNSPNYCDFEEDGSWMGTHGRRCFKSKNGTIAEGTCDILCCGRGYNTHQVWHRWKCHCQFKWCCDVHCLDCQKRVHVYTCN